MRRLLAVLGVGLMGTSCSLNAFTIEDDVELGLQVAAEIASDPAEYPLIARADAPDAYAAFDKLAYEVLDSGVVDHRNDFPWAFTLVDDDAVLNAFATPGGQVYVYTGLLKALDSDDALAGVIGHEIAHAAERHSTRQLTKIYGVSVLAEVLLEEDQQRLGEIAATLADLSFSRADERDADEHSVAYLCETPYAADGVALFFEDLEDGPIPAFLSTHPSSESRVEDVRATASELDCSTAGTGRAQLDAMIAALP